MIYWYYCTKEVSLLLTNCFISFVKLSKIPIKIKIVNIFLKQKTRKAVSPKLTAFISHKLSFNYSPQ